MSHIPVRPVPCTRKCALALAAALLILIVPSLAVMADPPLAVALGFTPTPTSLPPTATPDPGAGPTPTPEPGTGATPIPESQPDKPAPVITKRGEPAVAVPGEEVTFIIEATNHGREAAVDVVVVDMVPQYLEIVEVTATQGTVTIEGQKVIVHVGVIGSGFVVEITVRTRVQLDAPAPLDMENVALLSLSNGGDHTSLPATVVVPGERMPETGGTHPGVGGALLWLSVGATLVVALLGAWLSSRARAT